MRAREGKIKEESWQGQEEGGLQNTQEHTPLAGLSRFPKTVHAFKRASRAPEPSSSCIASIGARSKLDVGAGGWPRMCPLGNGLVEQLAVDRFGQVIVHPCRQALSPVDVSEHGILKKMRALTCWRI